MSTLNEQEKSKNKRRKSIVASQSLIFKVDKLGKELKISTRTKTLQFLTKFYQDMQSNESGLPVGTFDQIMKHDAPIVLCGIPGSGKSFTLDVFLKECKKRSIPFLLFNSDNRDHAWVTNKLEWMQIVSLSWLDSPSQYVVSLPSDLQLRKTTMYQISQTILRLEGEKRLEPWVLAFEESHDFHKIESFVSILRRMRKSTKKLIVISTEAELFRMCQPVRPIPH